MMSASASASSLSSSSSASLLSSSSSKQQQSPIIAVKRMSPTFPMTELKLEINGLTGPQLTRVRHALFKAANVSVVDCTIFANDTGVSDQVHAHQLSLVPVYLDPTYALAWHDHNRTVAETDDNTLVFTVTVDCPPPTRVTVEGAAAGSGEGGHTTTEIDHEVHVFARDLRFNPIGKQADTWISHPHYSPSIAPVMVLHPDMHLMTLKSRGRRSFHAEVKAAMGTVDENTRFTDVLNCYFRPLPTITIEKPIAHKDARVLMHLCKQVVFGGAPPPRPPPVPLPNEDATDAEIARRAQIGLEAARAAYQNELTYSVLDTLVPTLRDGFGAESITADTPVLHVLQPEKCNLCMACKNASLRDMEDLAKPSLLDALTISIPATRYLFFLRCNAKRSARDLLLSALDDLEDMRGLRSLIERAMPSHTLPLS